MSNNQGPFMSHEATTPRQKRMVELTNELRAKLAPIVSGFFIEKMEGRDEPTVIAAGIANALMQELAWQNASLCSVTGSSPDINMQQTMMGYPAQFVMFWQQITENDEALTRMN